MVTKERIKDYNKTYKKKVMQVRQDLYDRIGTKCFFCGYYDKLVCHRIDFKPHLKLAALTKSQLKEENPRNYARLCYKCHFGVHWANNILGMSWKEIAGKRNGSLPGS